MKKLLLIALLIVGCNRNEYKADNQRFDKLTGSVSIKTEKEPDDSTSVDHHSAEIRSIAVIVNFVSLPLISSVKSSSIFFPTMAWPKGEW